MKKFNFAYIAWFLILIYIFFCFLSFVYYEQKRVLKRFLLFIGFNLIILKFAISFSLGFVIKNNSFFWRVNPLLYNLGILFIFISFAMFVFSNSKSKIK
jgi:hypothetical protein